VTKSLTYVEIDVPSFVASSPEEVVTWRFAMPTDYLPADIDAIPSIDSVDFTPAMISLGKDLGQRASLRISFRDHKHIFNGEPFDQGTFFGKWRGRYGTKLRGRAVRLIRGQLGQDLAEMDTRHYVIDTTDGPSFNAVYTIEAKDVLKFADDDRAKAPALSNGSLAGTIDSSTASATLSPGGVGDLEYPESGWVCIGGDEVCAFMRSGDALTITRGQFGSVASGHDAGDRVQLVLRYTGDDPADVIHDLLTNYAGVPAEYIDLPAWQAETAEFLGVIYAATLTEPISVNKLVSELIEQAALAVWWDDRALRIRLQVLREISTDAATFGHDNIIAGSLSVKEQPGKRISQIWTYYGQRDPTDQSDNEDNYRAAIADRDLQRETEYGSAEIRKVQARWIETESAASRLNSIQLSRFRDPPRAFAFDLFRDLNIIPAAGYQVKWWGNQDDTGVEVPALIQVTQVTIHPDRIHIEAEEMLATGVIVLVNVVFLLDTGSVLQWQLPETWNDADNSVHCIGGGGGGASIGFTGTGGRGGGAGAFSSVSNLALSESPLPMISYRVGEAGDGGAFGGAGGDGGDTFFGGTSLGSCLVGAEGGEGGSGRTNGGEGGDAANGTGDVTNSGGSGSFGNRFVDTPAGGGAGGGAGGPNGDGATTANNTGSNDTGGCGGAGADGGSPGEHVIQGSIGGAGGDNRFDFGGGSGGVHPDTLPGSGDEGGGGGGGATGQNGAAGGTGEQIWTQTVSPIISAGPGGGGGGGGRNANGGPGGAYGGGGGGGGAGGSGGNGRQGIIVIQWREAE
jgi:hypothetical protein